MAKKPNMTRDILKECDSLSYINDKGEPRTLSLSRVDLGMYYNLNCLIHSKTNLIDLVYPLINYTTDDIKVLKQLVEIGRKAEKEGVLLLRDPIEKEYPLYIAFMKTGIFNAILMEYLNVTVKNQNKTFSPIHYMRGVLYGYKPKDIRGYYLRFYLLREFPNKYAETLKDIENVEYTDPDLFYQRRYDLVKNKNNFTQFDKEFKKTEHEALNKMKEMSQSKAFATYLNKRKKAITPYKFDVKRMFEQTVTNKTLAKLQEYYKSLK